MCTWGGGQREWTTYEYYGIMEGGGSEVRERCKDSCAYGIARAGGGVGDGVARESVCARAYMHV